jgi:membrane protein implicated in regulation of membrane protease activity
MDYLWIVWMVAGLALAVAEVFTLGFFLLWFGVGAIAASLVALAGMSVTVQVIVFLAVSIGLTVASRTIFDSKLFRASGPELKTGMASLPGQIGTVTESSKGALAEGAVRVFGSTWTAYPAEGEEPLVEGERVEVDRVDGAVLYVRRAGERGGSWRA